MTPRSARLSLALSTLAFSSALWAQTPPATPPPAPPAGAPAVNAIAPVDDRLETLKLSGAEIDSVLDLLTTYTGRVILRPGTLPPVAGGFTIKVETPTRRSTIISYLLTLLKQNNIGVTPMGDGAYTVVPLGFLKNEAPEMIEGSTLGLPPSGRIATKIFQLDFLRVNEFVPLIQASVLSTGIGGGVVNLDKANSAMITDTVSNLQRVERLLKDLDRPATSGLTPKFYTLRNGAKASEIVGRIRTTLQGTLQNQLGTSTNYSADDRTNQIILIADPRQYAFFDELIAKLDIKADPNTRMEVIYLKHAEAKVVATLLTEMITGQNNVTQRNSAQSVRPGQIAIPGQPVLPQAPGVAQPPQSALGQAIASAGGNDSPASGGNEFSALVTIRPDERSNAILISGTGDDVRLIRELVDKIDIVLAQVRIEVVITEVTLDDLHQSGISALGLKIGTDTPNGPGGDNGRGTHITEVSALSAAGWNITSGIVNPLSFEAALTNAGSKNLAKILSRPVIVTTHAKEAQVKVGKKTPVPSSFQSSPSGAAAGNTLQTQIQYQDIAIDLKVTPLIGDDGNIQLKIDQLVNDDLGSVPVAGVGDVPVIGTRQAVSYINVMDGQMVVLGGMMRNKDTNSRARLGFIYEIPLLGNLLGARQKRAERTELLLFVRPFVIKPGQGTVDTQANIDMLSNREQINQFLSDPSKPAKESVIERFK